MHVSCGDDRLARQLTQSHDRAVEIEQILFCPDLRIFILHPGRFQHEAVIISGLDLQIVVKVHDLREHFVGALFQNSLHELAHDTGAANDDTLPILCQQALGDPGLFEEISQMGLADHGIEVGAAGSIFCDQDTVMGAEPLYSLRCRYAELLDLSQSINLSCLEKRDHIQEDPRSTRRVIHCPVMIFQGDIQHLGDCVQGIFGVAGQEGPCHTQSVNCREAAGEPESFSVGFDKADIEAYIVAYQHTALAETQEGRQDQVYGLGVHDHAVRDPGQLLDPEGNRDFGINKLGEPVPHFAVYDLDGTDLDDPVLFRRKAGCLKVEDNKRALPDRSVHIFFGDRGHTFVKVIDQIALHPVKDLEKILTVDRGKSLFLPLFVFSGKKAVAGVSGVGKGLDIAVVCDGNGRHAPLISSFDQVLAFGDTVHIAHLGVAVEFHPLDRSVIHSLGTESGNLHDALNG